MQKSTDKKILPRDLPILQFELVYMIFNIGI